MIKYLTISILILSQPVMAGVNEDIAKYVESGVVVNGAKMELVKVLDINHIPYKTNLTISTPDSMRLSKRVSMIARDPTSGQTWYVPIVVKWIKKIVISKNPIPRRTRISRSMVGLTPVDVSGLISTFSNINDVIGMEATRNIKSEEPLLLNKLKWPNIIKRGDIVKIIFKFDGGIVESYGKAINSGRMNDRILVQNTSTKKVVQGNIINSSEIIIGGKND